MPANRPLQLDFLHRRLGMKLQGRITSLHVSAPAIATVPYDT